PSYGVSSVALWEGALSAPAGVEGVELLADDRKRLRALPETQPVDSEPASTHDDQGREADRGQDQSARDVVGEDLAGPFDGAEHPLPHGDVRDLADELFLIADAERRFGDHLAADVARRLPVVLEFHVEAAGQ